MTTPLDALEQRLKWEREEPIWDEGDKEDFIVELLAEARRLEQELAVANDATQFCHDHHSEDLRGALTAAQQALTRIAASGSDISIFRHGETLPVHCDACEGKIKMAKQVLASSAPTESPA